MRKRRAWAMVAVRLMPVALALLLVNGPARSQDADTGVEPQTTPSADATGIIGEFPEGTAPTEFAPMTGPERFRYYVDRMIGISSIFVSAAGAGIHQADNTPQEWKQGAEAYGERFGNSYAIHIIRGTLEYGASVALREDNRYFRSRESGFWKRSKHVIVNTLTARNDAGHEHIAYSRFGSALGAAFISRIWQPRSTDDPGDAAINFGTTMGVDIGRNMFHEFWPDIKRRAFKRGR